MRNSLLTLSAVMLVAGLLAGCGKKEQPVASDYYSGPIASKGPKVAPDQPTPKVRGARNGTE